ncbi:hypothetical protein AYI70_g459 [Smittium culicis]|uniref:Inosine/uridine-preferring nucleoside hydrolase domain-containing protein n=2 Tax=Smittium culicis TaxID=133412 RepID=A0A1R1YGX7_9FUNG|nr:hypothetical protein AYI70_g459 [Smittium culicis]
MSADSNTKIPIWLDCDPVRNREDAAHIHGETGLDGSDILPGPDVSLLEDKKNCFEAMRDAILSSPQPVVLAAVGPLTNIAILVMTYPEVTSNVREVLIMGGGIGTGNITPVAEFNIYADPEALQVVLQAEFKKVVMVPLNCTCLSNYTKEVQQRFTDMASKINPTFTQMINELTGFVRKSYIGYGLDPNLISWHDAIAVAHVVAPEGMYEDVDMKVTCVYGNCSGVAQGETIGDRRAPENEKNCTVVMGMDIEHFWVEMFEAWRLAAMSSKLSQ